MDPSGPVPTAGIPPPAPPPPSALFGTAKTLGTGRWTPANREHVRSVQTAHPPERPLPFAGVHPETLQHAAARLRPTQHREPLYASESEQLLDGSHQLAAGRHWTNQSQHAPLAVHKTGTEIHAPSNDPNQFAALRVNVGHSPSLSPAVTNQTTTGPSSIASSSASPLSYQQHNNNQSQQQQQMASGGGRQIPIQLIGPMPGQTYAPGPVVAQRTLHHLITDPKRYIHAYATQTPVATLMEESQQEGAEGGQQQQQQKTTTTINKWNGGVGVGGMGLVVGGGGGTNGAAGKPTTTRTKTVTTTTISSTGGGANNNIINGIGNGGNFDFAKELRDKGLTERQRAANMQKTAQNRPGAQPPSSLHNYAYQQAINSSSSTSSTSPYSQSGTIPSNTHLHQPGVDQVDQLIREMEMKMRTAGMQQQQGDSWSSGKGDFCTKCRQQISGDPPGVTALGQPYHVTCFCCDQCQKQLAGCSFYALDGKNLCQVDYMNSLEKCEKCKMPITQKILRALGKAFHPECFVCPACQKSLDGIPFTVDKENHAYCLDCYHERFSPRCAGCLKVIAPAGNETEVARVIAMDRSYHLDCYKCEDCGLKLNSKIEGQGCYPLESHLFCKNCNLKRLKALK